MLHPRVAARVIQELQGGTSDAANPFVELTPRELDSLKLIAQGLTNAQIAAQLVISENTVKGYFSNIRSKLHLADRIQAAVLAWRELCGEPEASMWVCGCVGVWVCGCVGVWVCGCGREPISLLKWL